MAAQIVEATVGIEKLLERFEYDQKRAIEHFLTTHSPAALILEQSVAPLEAEFGDGIPLALDLLKESGQEKLFIRIIVDEQLQDANTRLNAFRSKWWNRKRPQIPDTLYFALEFA